MTDNQKGADMDATTQSTTSHKSNIERFAEMGLIPPVVKQKGPRPAASYRAMRRNHVKAHRQLPAWRSITAAYANQKANIAGRQALANGAREAAAKALAEENVRSTGLRQDVVAASAMLEFYRDVKHPGRAVNRIIRSLESQIRAVGR